MENGLKRLLQSNKSSIDTVLIFLLIGTIVLIIIKPDDNLQKKKNITYPTPTPIVFFQKNQAAKSNFNLKGPLICSFTNKDVSWSASIKDSNILVRGNTGKEKLQILTKGDCVYLWRQGSYDGQKLCGIGQYLELVKKMQSFGLGNLPGGISSDTIQKNFPGLSASGFSIDTITGLLNACIQKEINNSIFIIPKEVVFREKNPNTKGE